MLVLRHAHRRVLMPLAAVAVAALTFVSSAVAQDIQLGNDDFVVAGQAAKPLAKRQETPLNAQRC